MTAWHYRAASYGVAALNGVLCVASGNLGVSLSIMGLAYLAAWLMDWAHIADD